MTSSAAKASLTMTSAEKRLMATSIRDAGATVEASSAAFRQFIGSSLRMLRIVPESELKMTTTKLAATASLTPQSRHVDQSRDK
jgi:hypothetical protein